MKRLTLILCVMLSLLAFSFVFSSTHRISVVKAAVGTVHIKADGSIDPPTAPISSSDNITYFLTGNIDYGFLIVERDNIIVNGTGFKLYGAAYVGKGIDLSNRNNVTIKNMEIKTFKQCVWLNNSVNIKITGDTVTNSTYGISVNNSLNASIVGNNVTANQYGILLNSTSKNIISGNNLTSNDDGVFLTSSSANNTISENNITNNLLGVSLDSSSYNRIVRNRIANNQSGVFIQFSLNTSIIGNNIIKGSDQGIGLYQSSNSSAIGNIIANTNYGITFTSYSSENTILGNRISNNVRGMQIFSGSNYNRIIGNNITSNSEFGILLSGASNNSFLHNNFNNTYQVYNLTPLMNYWNDSVEGNYWSDYTDFDSNHDGIGNSPYTIDGMNQDNFPLMGLFHSYNTSLGYPVNIITNSTINDFNYFSSNTTIKIRVSNMTATQSFGFCRISIHYALMDVNGINVVIDNGATAVLYHNYALHDDGTSRWIYFAYQHSTREIVILPEFPSALILSLFMAATLIALIVYRKKLLSVPIS